MAVAKYLHFTHDHFLTIWVVWREYLTTSQLRFVAFSLDRFSEVSECGQRARLALGRQARLLILEVSVWPGSIVFCIVLLLHVVDGAVSDQMSACDASMVGVSIVNLCLTTPAF